MLKKGKTTTTKKQAVKSVAKKPIAKKSAAKKPAQKNSKKLYLCTAKGVVLGEVKAVK